MKTTLKRGIGRPSTNGSGNGHAVFPPEALPAVRLYRQPPRQRRSAIHLVGTIALWLLAAAVVVGSGVAGGLFLYYTEKVSDIGATTPELKKAQEQLDVVAADEPAIALVIGYDKRQGPEGDLEPRSDTIMLVRADPDLNALSMMSLPRDLVVDVRCPGRAPYRDRINQAYTACGATGTLETVRALTKLPINYIVTVDFRGFKKLVAQVGGVWMDVDRRYFNDNSQGGPTYPTIDLPPGYQKLNGQDALDYARYRHWDNDFFRNARQQRFVDAFREAITSGFSPTKVPQIIDTVTSNVEVGVAGGELSRKEVLSYALLAYELRSGHVQQSRIALECYGPDDVAALTVAQECIDRPVREFSNPDVEAPTKATNVALGRKPPPDKAPPPRETTVVVLNGNGVTGAAANASYLLGQLGYATLPPQHGGTADAPTADYATTQVYFGAAKPARAAAEKLAKLFPDAQVRPLPREHDAVAGEAMIVVIVGATFEGNLVAEPVDQTPKRQPPQVYETPVAAEAARALRGRVRLRLLAPRRLPNGYVVSRDSAPRGYKVAGRPAARLTFTNGIDYFGLQMLRWDEAPALEGPDETVELDGRRFELHYSGPKLRMVVLRERGASYWVVNTLLNNLSNETMLSVARSLRPL